MIISEQIYELKLPSFSEIALPTFKGFDDDQLTTNYLRLDNLDHIIKPEYRNLLGLDWSKLNYFKKTNFIGAIHSDAILPEDQMFSINWIASGECLMEFYDHDEVEINGVTPGAVNKPDWGIVTKYKPICPPSKRYIMRNNKAYLVNVSTLHRALGFGPRKCYSLRTEDRARPWDDIVNLFDSLIVK